MSGEQFDENYWRGKLTEDEFRVCREKGTEPPFSGKYCHEKAPGQYHCRCCDAILFNAAAKYDSGSGWPSFYQEAERGAIEEHPDKSHGMQRTEIVCKACGCHLGHVFPDGPPPGGLRYCTNSASLKHIDD